MKPGYEKFFQQQRQILAQKERRKKANPFVLWKRILWVFMVPISLLALYFSIQGPEKILRLWDRLEISAFGLARAESEKKPDNAKPESKEGEKSAAKPGEKKEETAEAKDGQPAIVTKGWSEEEINLLKKLEERKRTLDTREADLAKLDAELQKQKDEIDRRLASLEQVRASISGKLEEKVKVDQEKVDALVTMYQNMKPSNAAKVIETLNEDLAVEVMTKMKRKSAAEILNVMNAEKAKKLTEKYVGYREIGK